MEEKKKPWPKSAAELKEAGYVFDDLGLCKAAVCQARLFWWTTPNGKHMPLTKDENDLYTPHFANCAARAIFQQKKGAA